jgi:RNA polymerase sigma-70 factor (ECF subfamily)
VEHLERDAKDERGRAADAAMERYATGDDGAFSDVYEALAPRLLPFLRRNVRDLAEAEDLLQQVLLHVHRGRASFLPGARVTPWAFAIARRLLVDAARRGRRQVPIARDDEVEASPPSSREPAADDVVHSRQIAKLFESELSRLPETQRTAFELVRQDGLSIAEAAQVLGTTPTAVKLRAHRAYDALRAVLAVLEKERLP